METININNNYTHRELKLRINILSAIYLGNESKETIESLIDKTSPKVQYSEDLKEILNCYNNDIQKHQNLLKEFRDQLLSDF